MTNTYTVYLGRTDTYRITVKADDAGAAVDEAIEALNQLTEAELIEGGYYFGGDGFDPANCWASPHTESQP